MVYDRAALIALPPAMRQRYAQLLCERLPAHVKVLLITLEFEGEQGPPFSVYQAEVEQLNFMITVGGPQLHIGQHVTGRTQVIITLTRSKKRCEMVQKQI